MNQFQFLPCGPLNCPDPSAAAFDVGRRLQRLWFHLQQAWLLADGDGIIPHQLRGMGITTAAQLRWLASQRQFELAERVIRHFPTIAFGLKVEDANGLCQKLEAARAEMIGQAFPEVCYDLFNELREGYRPDHREECFRDFLDRNVQPRFAPLRQMLRNALPTSDQITLDAGMVLEEGLARSDVYRFLPSPRASIEELGDHLELIAFQIRKMEKLEGRKMEEWDSYLVGGQRVEANLATDGTPIIDHRPGTFYLHKTWSNRLLAAWRKGGLPTDNLRHSKQQQPSRDPPMSLSEYIENLYDHACRTLAKTIGGERLKVDVENSTITVDGVSHSVEKQAAVLFSELLAAPSYSKPFSDIRNDNSNLFGPNDRLDRIRKNLPTVLNGLIVSGSGIPLSLNL